MELYPSLGFNCVWSALIGCSTSGGQTKTNGRINSIIIKKVAFSEFILHLYKSSKILKEVRVNQQSSLIAVWFVILLYENISLQ